MAEMKNRRSRLNMPMTRRAPMFEDELADSPNDLANGVAYPTNAHPAEEYQDMSRFQPMQSSLRDLGDGDYVVVKPRPSIAAQVREQILNNSGSSMNSMTFHSTLKKEDR